MDTRKIDINGVSLNYTVEGQGPKAVLLLHGWGCKGSTMALFAKTITSQCPGYTVYSIDLPGFGDSSEPAEVWGIEQYTRTIEEFTHRLGIESPVLIGHSFGGRISILYSSRNKTSKVILVDAAGVKPRRSLKYYAKVYSFKTAKHLLPLLAGKEKAGKIIDRWRGKAGSSDYASASPMMRAILSKCVNEDLKAVMPSIKAPTLLIWGENDTATPLGDAKIMEKLIPDAGLVSFPGCSHYSFLDNPAQTRAVVASFLNS